MNNMIEIEFPIDKKRIVTVRKSGYYNGKTDLHGIADISGVYNHYPVNKTIRLKNGVPFNVRGLENKFYVVNFAAETGYYSFYCKNGMTLKDIEYFYKILEEAEAPRYTFGSVEDYTIEQLQDMRRIDGIVEPVYTQDEIPKELQKKGVSEDCFERANLGDKSYCSSSELKMINEFYKK